MFTTEGHIVSVDEHLRESPWKEFFPEVGGRDPEGKSVHRPKSPDVKVINSSSNVSSSSQGWFACGGDRILPIALSSRVPDRKPMAHADWVIREEFHKEAARVGVVRGRGAGSHCHSQLKWLVGRVAIGAGQREEWGPPAEAGWGEE